MPQGHTLLTVGFSELKQTFRQLARLPHTLRFLIAYLFYNDGIQTVVVQASVFLSQELFTVSQRNAGEDVTFVLKIFLMIQFVAFFGALLLNESPRLPAPRRPFSFHWCCGPVWLFTRIVFCIPRRKPWEWALLSRSFSAARRRCRDPYCANDFGRLRSVFLRAL